MYVVHHFVNKRQPVIPVYSARRNRCCFLRFTIFVQYWGLITITLGERGGGLCGHIYGPILNDPKSPKYLGLMMFTPYTTLERRKNSERYQWTIMLMWTESNVIVAAGTIIVGRRKCEFDRDSHYYFLSTPRRRLTWPAEERSFFQTGLLCYCRGRQQDVRISYYYIGAAAARALEFH